MSALDDRGLARVILTAVGDEYVMELNGVFAWGLHLTPDLQGSTDIQVKTYYSCDGGDTWTEETMHLGPTTFTNTVYDKTLEGDGDTTILHWARPGVLLGLIAEDAASQDVYAAGVRCSSGAKGLIATHFKVVVTAITDPQDGAALTVVATKMSADWRYR